MRFFVYIGFLLLMPQLFGQSIQVANSYFEKGEFEKAVFSYEAFLQKRPQEARAIIGLAKSYRQITQFEKAVVILKNAIAEQPAQLLFMLELGVTYTSSNRAKLAKESFDKVILNLENYPNYASTIGRQFKEYSLLPYAIKSLEKAMTFNPNVNYNLELGQLYGELGELDGMFSCYLDYMLYKPAYINYIKRFIDQFITEDPENEANIVLRKTLLKKNQETPDVLYNEMLSWLFVQQKQYRKAFVQERAIYLLTEDGIPQLYDLGNIAKEAKDFETAIEVYEYVIEKSEVTSFTITSYQRLLEIKKEKLAPKEYESIAKEYEVLLQTYDANAQTLGLYMDYAHFIGFKQSKKSEAVTFLKKLSKKSFRPINKSKIQLLIGDILVLDEKFNQALIYYTKAKKGVKNHPLAQEASFKIAKASYYKGDFDWANTQLNVLKESTTQLIANDAMNLSLTIYDNTQDESEISDKALTLFAKAELKNFQGKTDEAIVLYNTIQDKYQGTSVEDDALYYQALLFEKLDNEEKAIKNLEKLLQFFPLSLLVDDALFKIGYLQEQLQEVEEAKKTYEKIIFNHADSIHYVEARKAYRKLRGDTVVN